ncbi:DUF2306 domain-containing protein [Rhizobium helianthi]|uniref:DUF2306 domain-containing protein n=1 Tax=Rhizobium helianthi TaxID=1132695 RepID=A0ABW4M7R2_9HYPH
MTLEPLIQASAAVQFHVLTVVPAAVLGAYLLLSPKKGKPAHRLLGKIWLTLMVLTSFSSFFIHALDLWNGFSPIHLLSILTLAGCFGAYRAARLGNIRLHRWIVGYLYIGGIVIAGGFTLMPHRIMNRVLLSEPGDAIVLVSLLSGIVLVALACLTLRKRKARAGYITKADGMSQ